MKRKTFYSLCQTNEVVGVVKHDGFQFEESGMKFYVYKNDNGITHIIDPLTGLSVWSTYEEEDDVFTSMPKHRIGKIKEQMQSEEYRIRTKIFKALKKAEKTREKYIAVLKNIEEASN